MRLSVSTARRTCGVSCRSSSPGAQWISSNFGTKASICAHYTQVLSAQRMKKVLMTTTQILGFVATGLVIVGYIPQIVHLIKERCTAGISISAFSLWCTASLLFLIHAAMIGDAVFVGAQTVNLDRKSVV